ncbi:MAG: hypothetical protein IJM17_05775 [Firmicutes bacterium]|nr:hypothetical protein [Bacillota bacterium]
MSLFRKRDPKPQAKPQARPQPDLAGEVPVVNVVQASLNWAVPYTNNDNNYHMPAGEYTEKTKENFFKVLKNAANKAVGVPKEMKALGAAAAKGKQGEVMNKLVNENLPNKDKLYGMESSKLSKELDINILYGKDSVYMAAPAANEAPKASAPVKEVQQAEKTAQSGPAPTVPMA